MNNIVAIIPARYSSSRFPGKPLAKILDVPLIVRVYQRVLRALSASQIFVATDDTRIRDVCEAADIQVLMTSRDRLTGTDRIYEAAQQLDAEIIINVQGDEPLINEDDIFSVIRAKSEYPGHVINAMCPIDSPSDIHSPNVPKVVVKEGNEMVYMSRSPIPYVKGTNVTPRYYRQVCIYAFHRPELNAFGTFGKKSELESLEDIEILRFLSLGIPVHMVEVSNPSIAVDDPKDIIRVEEKLRAEE